ncbi:UNVERIFIED_ORG: zinc/manganese transport system ATP-binding protein [Methylobacterium sp. SuP10 SLI 274]|uniref:metal ABC transporter ATP-binding protein n=1 Tax=Methylorubrum extorquens TaxID=408 RepID=UPI00209CCDC7|nr:ATP-binding cassette domain-containing protein [Methylorubrum extorquens]MDF9861703.1 zinc/manganese transport system ATP-binding protein [Methylorubrum pseudosasae]MDH6635330.1 zinc/manganese transport system ATP-binding protein [Methylobacterium sp. SuP10 SLI 274]MDH6664501.1 zinc/manganese transport system ATP-binding protein [Methylorubrum zatmanii]MCP1561501.1 zinc/manganese transport system ATP-binding protein [Methylorubrum extorquens]MDF9790003.1 zinc/manganese transport system ATP-
MSGEAARAGAIRFQGLTLGYDRHPAVHHLDGTIAPGDLLAVVGPNGAGKSTLLKGIVGEIRPLDGSVEAGPRSGAIAYLPQAAEIDRSFPLSVLDLVAMGLWRPLGAWRSLIRQRSRLVEALAAVGLNGFEDRPIGTLSGGQFQRALFARLILQDARIILLDEPFTGIDERTTADLLTLIRGWHREGRTVVAALHDLAQVRAHFASTLVLARRPIAWGPTREVLTPPVLARALRLSEAWDEAAAICRHDAHEAYHESGGSAPTHGHAPHDHNHDHHEPGHHDHDHGRAHHGAVS